MIKLKQLLFENFNESDLIVNSQRQSVSVSIMGSSVASISRPSTASIDNVEGNTWWVSRVLVGERDDRRKGIGSMLLQRAIKEVLKRDPKANIIVEPGGYDMKTNDQINFYKKNGFVDVPDKKGVLIYDKNSLIKENSDENWKRWINSMVSTVHDTLIENGESFTDVYMAYDIIKTNFRADAPSRDMFEKASKQSIDILKQQGIVK